MKTKHLLLAFALPAVLAACTNEELIPNAPAELTHIATYPLSSSL